jgi:isoleucyl-tRNA synthetase
LVPEIRNAYREYEFYTVVRLLLDLSIRDLSAFYLDITKDRLYCGLPWGRERRSAQTAIYRILRGMVILTAPILSFTCEEAWGHLRKRPEDPISVFLASFPEPAEFAEPDPVLMDDMAQVLEVRSAVLKEIERLRVAGEVGHPLEAAVHLEIPAGGALERGVRRFEASLPELFVVSKVTVTPSRDGLRVQVERAPGRRCARCWNWSERIPQDDAHPDLCERCAGVVLALARNG